MPQEAGTLELVVSRGAGLVLEKASDIVPTLRDLIGDPKRYGEMKAATHGLYDADSTEYIIREIAALMPKKQIPAGESIAA
jgi:UDP-N-acetylglucosamine:LPS N-acetylglucosamine transferase